MRFSSSSCKPDRKFYSLKKVVVMKIYYLLDSFTRSISSLRRKI
jgi:hypothetical protein